jgi:hypothetical protein
MSDIVQRHPTECPFIDRSFIPDPSFNVPVSYENDLGTYFFYQHDDGFGEISNVQFCQLIARKRDVFECLNKSEWENCVYCRGRLAEKGGEG